MGSAAGAAGGASGAGAGASGSGLSGMMSNPYMQAGMSFMGGEDTSGGKNPWAKLLGPIGKEMMKNSQAGTNAMLQGSGSGSGLQSTASSGNSQSDLSSMLWKALMDSQKRG